MADGRQPPRIGVAGLLSGTVIVATIAVVIAVPFGVLAALFITDYSDARTRRYLTALVDLLAAVPSLLYGIWGFLVLSKEIAPLSKWLAGNLAFVPLFKTQQNANFTGTMFIAGIVVSLMTLPIVASVVREVFAQTPPGEKEAALALGSTRWGMIRTVVLPFGRGGIIGGSMLGLGRALGETIAVALLLPQVPQITGHILENGGATVSGFIARRAGGDDFTDVRPHGGRSGPVLHDPGHQHGRFGRGGPQPLRSGGGPVTMAPEAPAFRPPGLAVPPPTVRAGGPPRRGRRPVDRTPDDLLTLGASLASAVSLCWLIFSRFTDGIGWFGFLVAVLASFLAIYYTVTAEQHGPLVARDRVATAVVMTGSAILLVPLAWLVGYVVVRGMPRAAAGVLLPRPAGDHADPAGHGGRWLPRHRRHARAGRPGPVVVPAAGPAVRGVPQRVAQPLAAARCGSSSTP